MFIEVRLKPDTTYGVLRRDEIAAANQLGRGLQTADDRHRVECRVHRSANEPFAANGGTDTDERERDADPRQHATDPSARASCTDPHQRLLNAHVDGESKSGA